MEQRRFPGSELDASVVGIGCNNFGMLIDAEATSEVVAATLDAGVTFFDTAAMYGGGKSEEFLGAALGDRRSDVVIATKFPMSPTEGACAPDRIRDECEASLTRLGTDYIDLYQQHYPDPATPTDEILATLGELRDEGKIRAIGHSNFTAAMHDDAETAGASGPIRFVSSQVEWSLLNRAVEDDVVEACARNNVGVLPYFPLASGLLTGKHTRETLEAGSRLDVGGDYFKSVLTDDNWNKVEVLSAWAADNGVSMLEVAIGWLAGQSVVTSVIAGAKRPEQIAANAAAGNVAFSAAQLEELSAITA